MDMLRQVGRISPCLDIICTVYDRMVVTRDRMGITSIVVPRLRNGSAGLHQLPLVMSTMARQDGVTVTDGGTRSSMLLCM